MAIFLLICHLLYTYLNYLLSQLDYLKTFIIFIPAIKMNSRMSKLRRSISRSVFQLNSSLSRQNSLNGLVDLPTMSNTTLVDKFAVSFFPRKITWIIYRVSIICVCNALRKSNKPPANIKISLQTPSNFRQLRDLIRNNNELLAEVVTAFEEKAALDFHYSKTLKKISIRLHKLTQSVESWVDAKFKIA